MKLLFLDLETTGLDFKKNAVIQIAGYIDIDGEIQEQFNLRCRPIDGKEVDPRALEVNGVSLEQIDAYANPKTTHIDLLQILDHYVNRFDKKDKFYLVGWNPRFDYDFLEQWFKDNGDKYLYSYINYHLIDLVAVTAMFQISKCFKTSNMRLKTVAEYLGYEFKAHDAFEDITVTRKIFYEYADHFNGIEIKELITK